MLMKSPAAKLVGSLVLALCLSPVSAQNQSYQEWLAQDQAAFTEYKAEVTRQYETFVEQEKKAFDAFVSAAGRVWGEQDVWVPEKKTWVQYSEDLEERSGVDFESGSARVQVVVDPDSDPEQVKAELAGAVERLALSGTECPIEMFRRRLFGGDTSAAPTPPAIRPKATSSASSASYTVQPGDSLWAVARKLKVSRLDLALANGIDPDDWLKVGQVLVVPGAAASALASAPAPVATKPASTWKPSKNPLLTGQLRTQDGATVNQANAGAYAQEVVAQGVDVHDIKGNDGTTRRVASVEVPLIPEHIRVRAERFRPLVEKFSKKYGIYPALVYALMETESAFNPRARSGVPAFGLMQLVPSSGARDAYRYVHKEDRLVPGSYLFDPSNNVQLGCAFLDILMNRYLKSVNDPLSRMFCAIAAYNTGAGNVARAFTNGRSVARAAPVINGMSSDDVYARLRSDLPYEETRNYIKKVTDRMPQYKAWN